MNIIIALIATITAVELYRFWLSVKPVTKKSHFFSKLKGTRGMRWDLEFKAAKTKQIREEIRKEYDFMQSRIASFTEALKDEKDEGKKGKLEDDKTRAERDAERLLAQIKGLDIEITGSKPTEQYPEGVQGINQQIESLMEVENMLKKHIKSL